MTRRKAFFIAVVSIMAALLTSGCNASHGYPTAAIKAPADTTHGTDGTSGASAG